MFDNGSFASSHNSSNSVSDITKNNVAIAATAKPINGALLEPQHDGAAAAASKVRFAHTAQACAKQCDSSIISLRNRLMLGRLPQRKPMLML